MRSVLIVTLVVIGLAPNVALKNPEAARTPAQDPAPMQTGNLLFEYGGYVDVSTNGQDSTYGQGLTHRYVDGEVRLLTLAFQVEPNGTRRASRLHEFPVPAPGTVQTSTTAEWDLSGTDAFLGSFHGIWFEQEEDRLWITSATDYTTDDYPARVTLVKLNPDGSVELEKQFFLNVPAKRVYGGCEAVPAPLVRELGGPYVCGWGGYTSLVAQGGGASIGPTMYAIPDPDTIEPGQRVRARAILDAARSRGVRLTTPINYFDGGDVRANPPTRPTEPPDRRADWLSPNEDGLGWMVWGDSYYNTGFWIGTTFGAVASLCKGACWYQSSTLAFDGRQYELHLWDGHRLGGDRLERPTAMFELDLPRGNDRLWVGNAPTGNVGGATYDAAGRRLFLLGFPLGPDDFTGRLYTFNVSFDGSAPGADAAQ